MGRIHEVRIHEVRIPLEVRLELRFSATLDTTNNFTGKDSIMYNFIQMQNSLPIRSTDTRKMQLVKHNMENQ
jgi:hypothetical protein